MTDNLHFTKTQLRILAALSDGEPHSKYDLHSCLSDQLSSIDNTGPHISALRKKLRTRREDILCVISSRFGYGVHYYQHVRLL